MNSEKNKSQNTIIEKLKFKFKNIFSHKKSEFSEIIKGMDNTIGDDKNPQQNETGNKCNPIVIAGTLFISSIILLAIFSVIYGLLPVKQASETYLIIIFPIIISIACGIFHLRGNVIPKNIIDVILFSVAAVNFMIISSKNLETPISFESLSSTFLGNMTLVSIYSCATAKAFMALTDIVLSAYKKSPKPKL
ncbi:hypothetical protein H4F33_13955 [Pectobacterium brasiliense]|uniref:hypothetical protein n=1 Tax=Pectobacterium brasiliense TaxID=180957 RepID=UPI0015DDF702|nr:hypothetical protein [Pectobacterium brasiliense]MBA0218804.1 hypothetical protein [Pectobacterium brasiliense]MBN3073186.1 hypothetical protein [Pectobacterium brasiliense]MBN3170607.1 hypothetical protein [Pectobacterium brasiliense]